MKDHGGVKRMLFDLHMPKFNWYQLFPAVMLGRRARDDGGDVRLAVQGCDRSDHRRHGALIFCSLSLLNDLLKSEVHAAREAEMAAAGVRARRSTWTSPSSIDSMATGAIAKRGTMFFGWLIGFMISMAVDRTDPDSADLRHPVHAHRGAGDVAAWCFQWRSA